MSGVVVPMCKPRTQGTGGKIGQLQSRAVFQQINELIY